MSKLAGPFTRPPFIAALVLVALAGCAHRVPPAQIVAQPDPVKVQDYVWEAEYDGLGDGVITEQQLGDLLDQARAKWPDRWEFQAMTASHYVRMGDQAQAKTYHENARALYAQNPAMQLGTPKGMGVSAFFGGPIGALVYAAMADETAIEFPPDATAGTWSPPAGTTYAKSR